MFYSFNPSRLKLFSRNTNCAKSLLITKTNLNSNAKSNPRPHPSKIPAYIPGKKKKYGEKTSFYAASIAVAMFGASFAAVPLYRIYCQTTGKGGQAFKEEENKIVAMKKDESRLLTIRFDATTHSSMNWSFKPLQDKIKVFPGETALAFYRATNPLDEPVIGVATYTVLPYEAGVYFNKIQCFCFEEQMLQPHEDVFMPVLFYVDPEICKDPALGSTDELVLSYTFFRSKDGELV